MGDPRSVRAFDVVAGDAIYANTEWFKFNQARGKDALQLVLFGSLLGLPVLSLPYTLKLLPHLFGDLRGWRERQLKEEDLMDDLPDAH